MKKQKTDPQKFWSQVQMQFDAVNFSNVLYVRDAIQYEPALAQTLIPFLTQKICVTDELEIQNRFDLLSDNAKFNFISLLCLSKKVIADVPEILLQDQFIKSIYNSYNENPPKISLHSNVKSFQPVQQNEKPPEIQSEIGTPEFFDEFDAILAKYPNYAESMIKEYLNIEKIQDFYNLLTEFYSQSRSLEGSKYMIKYCIKPYIEALESSANRIIYEALLLIAHSVPDLLIDGMIQPIVFDPNSKIYQFELIQRLFREELICKNMLSRIFLSRPPSIEPKLQKDGLNIIKTAIQKSPQLTDELQRHVLLHIRNQIEHWKADNAYNLLIFFFKYQNIHNNDIKQMAADSISLIPDKMRSIALQQLNRQIH